MVANETFTVQQLRDAAANARDFRQHRTADMLTAFADLLEGIAKIDPFSFAGDMDQCNFCDAPRAWDDGGKPLEYTHKPDCLWVRAQAAHNSDG